MSPGWFPLEIHFLVSPASNCSCPDPFPHSDTFVDTGTQSLHVPFIDTIQPTTPISGAQRNFLLFLKLEVMCDKIALILSCAGPLTLTHPIWSAHDCRLFPGTLPCGRCTHPQYFCIGHFQFLPALVSRLLGGPFCGMLVSSNSSQ